MSDNDNDGTDDKDYVGYGHPPKFGRFKKGVSGNPSGRPRRRPSVSIGMLCEGEYDRMTLEEMARFATVREGCSSERVRLDRAAIRAMNHKAAKGDVAAFKEMTKRRDRIEQRREAEWKETLKAVLKYIEQGHKQIRIDKKLGDKTRDIIPHPDDIDIDFANRQITFNGPMTYEQKMAQDFMVANYEEFMSSYVDPSAPPTGQRTARLIQRMKRQLDTVKRLVGARASNTNSWTAASLEERTEFLRRHVWPAYSAKLQIPTTNSDLWFKLSMRRVLNTEWTEDDEEQLKIEIRKAFPLPQTPERARSGTKARPVRKAG